jgi:uncharacterized membrane protein YgdD (TMEM256/DUF423 family)
LVAAGVAGLSGVVLGAFSAHGLEAWLVDRGLDGEKLVDRLAQAETGVRYHLVHAVALLGLFAAVPRIRPAVARLCGVLMSGGILLFSGSLYLLVALDLPWLGAITPLGGLSWIVAWGLLCFAAARSSA